MQLLYQMDVTGVADAPDAEELAREIDVEFNPPDARPAAVELARGAWETRHDADRRIAELAPDWPTHRQPPVDRAILRLAWYELTTGRVPPAVALNEAVELAKGYGSEHSPAFVNGVLDKIAKDQGLEDTERVEAAAATNPDDWLADAVRR